jgi:iron complex transport system ATP-binding protein
MTLRADAIHFSFGPRRVLRGVSLEAPPGTLTVLAGPNGAGKSTLLRIILGVLRPHSGRVTLGESDVHALPARERARRIAYHSQRPSVAFPYTVAQVAAMGRFASPDVEPTRRALAQVGLADRAGEVFGALSAGQQQRVSLARALAQLDGLPHPVLLADEPVSAMDPRHALETLASLHALARAGGIVVVVLHDLALAARFADRALLLRHDGSAAAAGAAGDVLAPERLAPVYGVVFTRIPVEGGFSLLPGSPP